MDFQESLRLLNALDPENRRSLGKVIFGHENWLDRPTCDWEKEEFSAELFHGHNMEPDGRAPKEYVNGIAMDKDGKALKVDVEETADGYRLSFKGNGNGPYTLYDETQPMIWNLINDGSWTAGPKRDFSNVKSSANYQQYAKIVFSQKEPSRLEQTELELVSDDLEAKAGKEASFTLYYEGKPLPGVKVKFFSKKDKVEIFAETDAEGRVSFVPTTADLWMALARYKDESKSSEDEFDETVFVTTLTMRAVRAR